MSSAEAPPEVLIDSVVASVNDKPITLSDVQRRISKKEPLDLSTAARDPQVQQVVDALILERLVEEEATARKLNVAPPEIERYFDEVAKRNNLSREGFEAALRQEGLDPVLYREQVRADILRSKLTSVVTQASSGVSAEEVTRYKAEHPELTRAGTKLKIRQIFLGRNMHTAEEGRSILEALRKKLEAGGDFAAAARELSESPDAREGGLLGVVAEKDLSPTIFDAVFALEPGHLSAVIDSPNGTHLFKLEERFSESEAADSSTLDEEIRKTLQQQKFQTKVQTFLSTDIYKLHAVDKKI